MKLKIIVNMCCNEIALVNITNKKVLIRLENFDSGESSQYIHGYLQGLRDSNVEYQLLGRMAIDYNDETGLFSLCDFNTSN